VLVAEAARLLSVKNHEEREKLFKTARELRAKHFGDRVFLYGFVYFSTYCKNDCSFCNYRVSGKGAKRYRKSADEIAEIAVILKETGVHLIDLTMGEDEYYHENQSEFLEIIRRVKAETNLPVMVSPGVVSRDLTDGFAEIGVDWYALYQETFSRELFTKTRVNQSYDRRIEAKNYAKSKGILIEEGLLTGVGGDVFSLADSVMKITETGASQIRVMTYIPPDGALGVDFDVDFDKEILSIAVMRILYPDLLIPASMDVCGADGLEKRLNAGANVVTSLVPPNKGLSGVASVERGIDDGGRTVLGISETLKKCGLRAAELSEYRDYINGKK